MTRCFLVTVPAERSNDVVFALQEELHIANVVRTTSEGVATLRFNVPCTAAGLVVHKLDKLGVGVAFGEVTLLQVPMSLPKRRNRRLRKLVMEADKELDMSQRLAVEEIYATIASGTSLNFEYFAFVVCAAIIAATGLGTNNTVMIVASMLVSPLMGPILAFTLATNLRDWPLFRTALFMEALGIATTFLVGFALGLLAAINNVIPSTFDWPTDEMNARGETTNLVLGIIYAVPSGVAVALASTNPNTGVVVGVAIAASLLPPITNSGVCFGYAAAGHPHQSGDYVTTALYSLALFGINVVCIYLSGVVTFAIKRMRHVVRPQLSTYKPLPPVPMTVPAGLDASTKVDVAPDSAAKMRWRNAHAALSTGTGVTPQRAASAPACESNHVAAILEDLGGSSSLDGGSSV